MPVRPPDVRPGGAAGARPARVLVVDDTPQIRMLLRLNLALEGHHVEEAADGQSCLERLRADPPVDVLVIDALMGPVDGWATTAALRADPALVDLPVLMVTASVQAHHRARAAQVGVDVFVSKPFEPADVVEAVETLAAHGRPGRPGRPVRRPAGAAYPGGMTPTALAEAVHDALVAAVRDGDLRLDEGSLPEQVRVERPRDRAHGDWATNVALQLAKAAGAPPRAVAEALATRLRAVGGVSMVDVAGPGFLNITVDAASAGELARTVVAAGQAYGRSEANAGLRVNLEYVSANPTGPIHLGGTRWAAVGDSLARVLAATGAEVTREYYFNDHGGQIDRFARSLLAAARHESVPQDGYAGTYVDEIAAQVVADAVAAGEEDPATTQEAAATEVFRARGTALMFAEIRQSLHDFGVDFDVYTHEGAFHDSGAVGAAVQRLKDSGSLYEEDGAWWLRSTDHGDDKDRVVVKSDGQPAYVAGDLAYYLDKRARGADLAIYLLGADHHGYVARLKAAAAAFGDDPDRVEVLIGQMVNLVREGQPVRMSKRAGTVVTLEDLVDAVGVDAARYSLVRSSMDSTVDIDLDVLTKRTNDNPVFYVQYAHARAAGVSRNAADLGVALQRADGSDGFDPALLEHPSETALLAAIADHPRVVAQAAALREPHRVARSLEALAGSYHRWYDARRVTPMGEEEVTDVHRTRLWLNRATTTVLANGLGLLGVSAPERM